ncbi:thioredoxin-like protein [Pilobolus umbonatus]|nr:thioredoxin-like protein [Pilobolus umbonatus]
MKLFSLLTCILSIIVLCGATIVEMGDENFDELVGKGDEWLIDFYANWCGHCRQFEHKFHAVDRLLSKSSHRHVRLGMVNIDENPGLSARFFVSRLPTVVHIKDHEVRVLNSIQRENDIIGYVTLEEWKQDKPKSGFISPFGLFGRLIGVVGKTVKKLSGYSPWTMVGVLTGFLIFAFSTPYILGRTMHNMPVSQNTEIKEKATPPLKHRKSKRID